MTIHCAQVTTNITRTDVCMIIFGLNVLLRPKILHWRIGWILTSLSLEIHFTLVNTQ